MIKRIHRLPPTLAEQIAAGEVIERPASVVKELVENSLDAGATEVAVRLEDGGKSLIEILDNGHGMSPDDLAICVERHTTSKLLKLEDLDNILTLGFRGEALASVAAVSDLSIISRTPESSTAYELKRNSPPEKVTFGQFIDMSHGTRIQARGLFSQIPARFKFLKSQAAEVSQTREWMERLALAYPQVGFQLFSDDRTILNLRPTDEVNRVRAILSDGDDYPIQSATHDQDGFRDRGLQIRIHWLQGLSCSHSRKLIQVVNSRATRDRLLQQALLSPFKQALLPGQFPAAALFVQINPAAIDVNVHPTKTEIRFLDSRKIFQSVETLIQSLLNREGAPAIVPNPWKGAFLPPSFSTPQPLYSTPTHSWTSPVLGEPWQASEPVPQIQIPMPELAEAPALPQHPFARARFIGTFANTYLLYENQNELILIDQHAAHERVRYEKLKARHSKNPSVSHSQDLLVPEVIKFLPEAKPMLENKLPALQKWGFDIEVFGEDALLFRSIPADWGNYQLKTRLKNLVDRVLEAEKLQKTLVIDELIFESLASEACHSAVRAGDRLETLEIHTLMEQLFQCEHPWNCPHGRPTVVQIPEGKLEDWFQRAAPKSQIEFN